MRNPTKPSHSANFLLGAGVLCALLGSGARAQNGTSDVSQTARQIREPALSTHPYPLPLSAHWNSENAASEKGLDEFGFVPGWQLEQIRNGRHLLP